MSSKQARFSDYPLDGHVTVAGEVLTTPCHIYDGVMLLFGGTVHAEAAHNLLSEGGLTPVLFFGSAIVPRKGHDSISAGYRALLGFHRLYSRALMRSAVMRLETARPPDA